jgi:hypothetical protein
VRGAMTRRNTAARNRAEQIIPRRAADAFFSKIDFHRDSARCPTAGRDRLCGVQEPLRASSQGRFIPATK